MVTKSHMCGGVDLLTASYFLTAVDVILEFSLISYMNTN